LGVIGLGAIGGSVAWQSSRAGVPRLIGYSPVPAEAVSAAKAGAITDIASSPGEVAASSDLVILAAPPAANLQVLSDLASKFRSGHALVTDVTGVKGPIVDLASQLGLNRRVAGSHPLCGTHETGFAAARPDLLRGAVVYVSPLPDGEEVANEVSDFWERVCDALPVVMDAARHDRLLAWTSHLPQAVASALAVALGGGALKGATFGPGARDTTRLAASSAQMWSDTMMLNREAVLEALDAFDDAEGALREALRDADRERLTAWLETGVAFRRNLDP
jgi:prephenate dehydrogenase